MCGIAGIIASDAAPVEVGELERMAAMLGHRGPDARGLYSEPGAGLVHTRLSVIDIEGGAQPMSNSDGSLRITFNGEIFNYVELREELVRRGHRFRTRSDTEVLLQLYEAEGPKAVEKLNGQWAFAIWDSRSRTLFLSRDRVGVRPLFYTRAGGRFLFASEIKALFADPAVSRELDPYALDNIFTFWTTVAPRTPFRSISTLPPGQSLIWHEGRCTTLRHWQPTFDAVDRSLSEDEALPRLRETLEDATRVRLRSDIPVGAYLSGGLDSALVVALMTQSGATPSTFSIAFDEAEFDESAHQREVARALQTHHVELRCTPDDISRAFPDVVWHAETPLLRTAPAPLFLLSRLARQHGCTVVLTGEGADEIFGGYDIFKEAKIRRFWARFPDSPRRASLVRRLYPYLPDLHRQPVGYLQNFFHVAPEDLASPWFSHLPRWRLTSRLKLFLSEEMRTAVADFDGFADLAAGLPSGFSGWDSLSQSQFLETSQLLPGYLLSSQGDRVAMAHGVEGRHPFLDHRVVSFASSLHPSLRMKGLQEKYLLKRFARDFVPASVRRRPKQPYRAPAGRAFFGASRPEYVADMLSPQQVKRDGIFNPGAVSKLARKFEEGRAIGMKDEMALVGILSTQLLVDRFINHFQTVTP